MPVLQAAGFIAAVLNAGFRHANKATQAHDNYRVSLAHDRL
jgi:hypothetical protein